MPRKPRVKSSTGVYHVMLRGVNRQNIFEEDADRIKFIDILSFYKPISLYKFFGYCLMSNHVHLLVQETCEPISKIIKRISSSYVNWYNKKYDRSGHLFQERFKSEAVENDQYFITALRYIHQNPIKAGITNLAGDYRWSSYHDYVRGSRLVDIDFALNIFSNDKRVSVQLFQAHTNEENDDQGLEYQRTSMLSDNQVIELIKGFGIANVSDLQKLEIQDRNLTINRLKHTDGVSIRQIERITGISKSVIARL